MEKGGVEGRRGVGEGDCRGGERVWVACLPERSSEGFVRSRDGSGPDYAGRGMDKPGDVGTLHPGATVEGAGAGVDKGVRRRVVFLLQPGCSVADETATFTTIDTSDLRNR